MKKSDPLRERTVEALFGTREPVRLEFFRVCLGTSMLLYFLYLSKHWTLASEWLTSQGFHDSPRAMTGLPMPPLLQEWMLPWFGLLFFGSLLCWTLGVHARRACWASLALVLYVSLADVLSNYTVNRLFIVGLAVMSCTPHGDLRPRSVWPMRILQTFIILQYFGAGWAKIVHGEWLRNPDVLWQHAQTIYRNDLCAWLLAVMPRPGWTVVQNMALLFELSVPITFGLKRLRAAGLVVGCLFHLTIALLMQDLIYFGLTMASFYVLFVPEAVLIRLWNRVSCLKMWAGLKMFHDRMSVSRRRP